MRISKIDVLFELCVAQIREGTIRDERIVALLVQGLIVSICAEFETILKDLTNKRGIWLREKGACNYNTKYAESTFRSANPGYIETAVRRFGDASRDEFHRLRTRNEQTKRAWEAYESIIANRNDVAHGRQFQATLSEVYGFYERGHIVLDWFKSAIWIETVEGEQLV